MTEEKKTGEEMMKRGEKYTEKKCRGMHKEKAWGEKMSG